MNLRRDHQNNILGKFEDEAKEALPKAVFDFIAGGAGDESALYRNRQAYLNTLLIPRVLNSVESVEINTEIFGIKSRSPIIIAPTSYHGLVNQEKEIATARAAKKSGCIMTVSMMANTTVEQIAESVDSSLWFQLHIHKDKKITEDLIKRAETSNYKAIVVTVDIPQMGVRKRDLFNQFVLPKSCVPVNFLAKSAQKNELNSAGTQFNPSATWEDIAWMKSITKLPIILKGILHHEDAIRAMSYGADGIVISNHGGRQLDDAVAPLTVLPKIAAVVNKKIPILIDGGIRSGSDVLKAIALGADAVLVGRPILWALAVRGQNGVENVLECLMQELSLTMKLVGCSSIQSIKEMSQSIIFNDQKSFDRDCHDLRAFNAKAKL